MMTKEEIEKGMKCCNEFACGECPYEKYDDKKQHLYTMRCIHMLMHDITKLYFDMKNKKPILHTNENCRNLTCKHIEFDKGFKEALEILDGFIVQALDNSDDQTESMTLRWVLDQISMMIKENEKIVL